MNQKALLHAISKALRRVIPFDRAAFTLYVPEKDRFRFLAIEGIVASSHFRAGLEFGRDESISAWVFDHQRPALCHDLQKEQQYPNDRHLIAEGLNSYCVVPLIIGGKSIGTLNLASEKTNQYSEADAEFLCELGSQVALAVSNMTSYEEIAALNTQVERTAERYRTLLEINNAIITHLTPEALLRSLSEILRRVVPFQRGGPHALQSKQQDLPLLRDGEAPSNRITSESGSSSIANIPSRPGFSITRRAVVRRDLEKEQQYPNDSRLVAAGIYSDCIVPLIVGGKSIGTLNVGSAERNQYSEADLETLQEIGESSRACGRQYAVL